MQMLLYIAIFILVWFNFNSDISVLTCYLDEKYLNYYNTTVPTRSWWIIQWTFTVNNNLKLTEIWCMPEHNNVTLHAGAECYLICTKRTNLFTWCGCTITDVVWTRGREATLVTAREECSCNDISDDTVGTGRQTGVPESDWYCGCVDPSVDVLLLMTGPAAAV